MRRVKVRIQKRRGGSVNPGRGQHLRRLDVRGGKVRKRGEGTRERGDPILSDLPFRKVSLVPGVGAD